MRGKVVLLSRFSAFWRITPACAGKSFPRRARHGCRWDHPRVCGEKTAQIAEILNLPGSPPRVRGKVCTHLWTVERDRITPACAGKSSRHPVLLLQPEDHPRVCGEKLFCCQGSVPFGGSPPRVRGKASDALLHRLGVGITPACAGKRLKKAHKIKDFDPVPIRFHLVFRRFERWCSNLPTLDGNVPV